MTDFNWTCPHCENAVTISEERITRNAHMLGISNADGIRHLLTDFIVCPNPQCRRFTLIARLYSSVQVQGRGQIPDTVLQKWRLMPPSNARTFPSYIPPAIIDDYREACAIRDLCGEGVSLNLVIYF